MRYLILITSTVLAAASANALAAVTPCNGSSVFPPCLNPNASDLSFNTAGGFGALPVVNGATNSTAFGQNALFALVTGNGNTAIGAFSLTKASDANSNTAIGAGALQNSTASAGTAVGYLALSGNVSGVFNTAVGTTALLQNQGGSNNTALGALALQNSVVSNNNAIGAFAMQDSTTGSGNNAQGTNAMQHNQTGSNNVAVGNGALRSNQAGNGNIALGNQALLLATGGGNIAVGSGAGKSLTTGSNNIYIGSAGLATESSTIRIGAGVHDRTFIAGIAESSVGNAAAVQVNTQTGQLGILLSSARYKDQVRDVGEEEARLAKLRPVTFVYKADKSRTKRYGLVAEEVATVYPELVAKNADGEAQTVEYQALIPLLLKQSQQQTAQIRALEMQVAELKRRLLAESH